MKHIIIAVLFFVPFTSFAALTHADINQPIVTPSVVFIPQTLDEGTPVSPEAPQAPTSYTSSGRSITPEGIYYRELERIVNQLKAIVAQLQANLTR